MEFTPARPGSAGEHALQERFGTTERANRFYSHQMLEYLNDRMQIFVGRQEMIFISTSDGHGECDCSFRAGPPGFVRVLDDKTITWPEYRGNGVLASAGNISENPHVGVLMIDFVKDVIGLHVNGKAEIVTDEQMRQKHPWLIEDDAGGRSPERWVVVHVEEAYVHCSKHIPRMVRVPTKRATGVGENRRPFKRKGGDYFAARDSRSPWKEALDPDLGAGGEQEPDEEADEQDPAERVPAGSTATQQTATDHAGDDRQDEAYDTCGLDLPDEPASDTDGAIWRELTTARHSADWLSQPEPRPTHRDPLAAAVEATATADQPERDDADRPADEQASSTSEQSSPLTDPWSSPLWTEQQAAVDQDDPPEPVDEATAYVGSDPAASLLYGAGFDPYGPAPRRSDRDDPEPA